MKSVSQKHSGLIFGAFIGAQCLVPLASMALFRSRYNYPYRTITYHGLLVALAYLVMFGAAVALSSMRAVRRRPISRFLLPLAWGSIGVALYFIYLLAWGGRVLTGTNLTFFLVAPYVKHPSEACAALGISLATFWVILAGVPGAILLGYALAARAFSAVLLRLRTRLLPRRSRTRAASAAPPRERRFASITLAAGLALCVAVVSLWLAPPPRPIGRLFGDPILTPLVDENVDLPIIASSNPDDDLQQRAYPASAQHQKKNVILIVLDACRADHLGLNGYARDTTPFLDSLQRTGNLRNVRTFYSASCCTFGGVLTLLRSQNWFRMAPRAFALPDVLKKSGYRVHFVLGGDLSNFHDLQNYYGNGIDTFSDGISADRHFSVNDDRGVFEAFSRVPASDGTPAFLYFHLMSIHPLGVRMVNFMKYKPAVNRRDPVDYANGYDNGILQADSAIRELFHRLEAKGYLQNSLVVITGDHGDSLGERGLIGHSHNLYAEEVTPPLLIYDADPAVMLPQPGTGPADRCGSHDPRPARAADPALVGRPLAAQRRPAAFLLPAFRRSIRRDRPHARAHLEVRLQRSHQEGGNLPPGNRPARRAGHFPEHGPGGNPRVTRGGGGVRGASGFVRRD